MVATIRQYLPRDHDETWALHCRSVAAPHSGFVKNLGFHSDIHNIPNLYEAFFLMHEGGQLIGMVGLKRIDARTLEVKRLQVADTHQGKGYGKQLMQTVFDYAKAHDIMRLTLDVSAPHAKACDLYLALGFIITRTATETFGPDNEEFFMTYMEKEL